MNAVTLALLFTMTSAKFNLPTNLLASLCYIESHHDVKAINHDDGGGNSVGVCQVKLSTAKWLGFKGTEEQLMKPKTNVYYAGKYLSAQIKRYGSVKKGVVAYNIGNAKGLTRSKYSDKVLRQWRIINEHTASNNPILERNKPK